MFSSRLFLFDQPVLLGNPVLLEHSDLFKIEQHVNNRTLYAVVLRRDKHDHNKYTRENPMGQRFEVVKGGKLRSARG